IQFKRAIRGNVLENICCVGHQQSRRRLSDHRICKWNLPLQRRCVFEVYGETLLCEPDLSICLSFNFYDWKSGLLRPAGSDLADRFLLSFRQRAPQIRGGRARVLVGGDVPANSIAESIFAKKTFQLPHTRLTVLLRTVIKSAL